MMASPTRRPAGRRRILLTFSDQAVSSASNFVTGVAVARLAGVARFGDYMLTIMVWLIVVGVHRAVITEPIIVTGGQGGGDRRATLAHGLTAELLLAAAASAVVATSGLGISLLGADLGRTMLALAPWFAPLLVQDYWRAMAFQQRRPGLALVNDLTFAGVQVAAIVVFALHGWRTVGFMLAAWGLGATAGALLGLLWFPVVGGLHASVSMLRRMWPLSRWMLADFATGFGSDQAYLAFAAVLLSRADYGGYRAAFSLMGPTVVILLAGGNLGLPEASRRADPEQPAALRVYARRLTTGILCCVGLYCAAVAVGSGRLLGALYGPAFSRYGVLATLSALQYVLLATVFGQLIALKAAGRMRLLWRVRIGVFIASLSSMTLLVRWLGTPGAGWAGVATAALYLTAIQSVYRRELGHRPAAALSEGGGVPRRAAVSWSAPVRPEIDT